MSKQIGLDPGESIAFAIKPAGLTTLLSIKGNDDGETTITYHFELCHEPDYTVTLKRQETKQVDVSHGKGSLCTVRNTGFRKVTVWTDY
jgi:hypothetical protein